LRSAYDHQGITNRELARKTAYLVQENTQAGVIREAVAVYEINPQTLEKIAASDQPDTVKVFNLLKSIAQKVQEEAARSPYLISIGERAEAIAEAFKLRQLSTQDTLAQLQALIGKMNEAERQQAERGISGEAFAAFWILQQQGIGAEPAERAAREMLQTFADYPHWQASEAQGREVRRKLYDILYAAGVGQLPETVGQIMAVIQRRPA